MVPFVKSSQAYEKRHIKKGWMTAEDGEQGRLVVSCPQVWRGNTGWETSAVITRSSGVCYQVRCLRSAGYTNDRARGLHLGSWESVCLREWMGTPCWQVQIPRLRLMFDDWAWQERNYNRSRRCDVPSVRVCTLVQVSVCVCITADAYVCFWVCVYNCRCICVFLSVCVCV